MPRGTSSPEEQVIAKKTTGASCPWNMSTVPTRTPVGHGLADPGDGEVVGRDHHQVAGLERARRRRSRRSRVPPAEQRCGRRRRSRLPPRAESWLRPSCSTTRAAQADAGDGARGRRCVAARRPRVSAAFRRSCARRRTRRRPDASASSRRAARRGRAARRRARRAGARGRTRRRRRGA